MACLVKRPYECISTHNCYFACMRCTYCHAGRAPPTLPVNFSWMAVFEEQGTNKITLECTLFFIILFQKTLKTLTFGKTTVSFLTGTAALVLHKEASLIYPSGVLFTLKKNIGKSMRAISLIQVI